MLTKPQDLPTLPETGVGRSELIRSDIEVSLMYIDLANDHSALIDWIEAQQRALGNKRE